MIYFILGIAFYGFAMPVVESMVSLICTWFEYLKTKIAVKMVKLQSEIESEGGTAHAIGFDTSSGITLEEDDEDWEDEE